MPHKGGGEDTAEKAKSVRGFESSAVRGYGKTSKSEKAFEGSGVRLFSLFRICRTLEPSNYRTPLSSIVGV
jgi:hypothetical protein